MPLDWNELDESPDRWTLLTVPARLKRLRVDPWKDYWHSAQVIPAASLAAISDQTFEEWNRETGGKLRARVGTKAKTSNRVKSKGGKRTVAKRRGR
jgi:hypothetical protein